MLSAIGGAWNRFFYVAPDARMFPVFRIGYGILLCIYLSFLGMDLDYFFCEDGVLPLEASYGVVHPNSISIFHGLPDTQLAVWICYCLFCTHAACFLIGFFSRVQAIAIFFWLVSFHHRNIMIFEGEDTVFRMFAFFMIFGPLGARFSIDNWISKRIRKKPIQLTQSSGWALRLIQFQLSIIYLSTALEKYSGEAWHKGTALYYASRLHDLFGRFPVPSFAFDNLWTMKVTTWVVLVLELLLPIGLWIPKTRLLTVVLAFGLHLGIEWTMNLFLFQWIMMLGLLMFVKPNEIPILGRWITRDPLDEVVVIEG